MARKPNASTNMPEIPLTLQKAFDACFSAETQADAGSAEMAKVGHSHFSGQQHAEEPHVAEHGLDSASHDKHASTAESIADSQALLCGRIGMGAYESMRRLNIQPVVTSLRVSKRLPRQISMISSSIRAVSLTCSFPKNLCSQNHLFSED
jgi:hypothetical protein